MRGFRAQSRQQRDLLKVHQVISAEVRSFDDVAKAQAVGMTCHLADRIEAGCRVFFRQELATEKDSELHDESERRA